MSSQLYPWYTCLKCLCSSVSFTGEGSSPSIPMQKGEKLNYFLLVQWSEISQTRQNCVTFPSNPSQSSHLFFFSVSRGNTMGDIQLTMLTNILFLYPDSKSSNFRAWENGSSDQVLAAKPWYLVYFPVFTQKTTKHYRVCMYSWS